MPNWPRKKNNTTDFPLPSTSENLNDQDNKPHYSSMKNGTLPTYREWKNKTLKKSTTISHDNVINNNKNNDDNISYKNEEDINIETTSENQQNLAENQHFRQ